MIVAAARAALGNLLSPDFRPIVLRTLGLTVLVLLALWFALNSLFGWLALPWIEQLLPDAPLGAWLGLAAAILVAIGLAIGLAFLAAPVTAAIAGIFLDTIAEAVERADYPSDPPGRALPTGRALVQSLKFLGIVIVGNLVALALLLVPVVNLAAFFLVNGYLLGREYFEFAAMRHMPEAEAKAMRRRHATTVFLAGLVISAMVSIPFANLLAPFFAASLMTHLVRALSQPGRP